MKRATSASATSNSKPLETFPQTSKFSGLSSSSTYSSNNAIVDYDSDSGEDEDAPIQLNHKTAATLHQLKATNGSNKSAAMAILHQGVSKITTPIVSVLASSTCSNPFEDIILSSAGPYNDIYSNTNPENTFDGSNDEFMNDMTSMNYDVRANDCSNGDNHRSNDDYIPITTIKIGFKVFPKIVRKLTKF